MKKAVLISIRPKWVELIASGEKTIEVRKSAPKLGTPFKCYIYCTLTGAKELAHSFGNSMQEQIIGWNKGKWGLRKGKVVGEFVCDYIREYEPTKAWTLCGKAIHYLGNALEHRHTALFYDEIEEYGNGATLYAWHISDFKIYDKPKSLRKVIVDSYLVDLGRSKIFEHAKRPPQSWCYIEGVEE